MRADRDGGSRNEAPAPRGGPPIELTADDLLSITDHELGNLTTVHSGLASHLDDLWDAPSEPQRRELVRRLAWQTTELSVLLRNLRTLRRSGGFEHAAEGRVDHQPSRALSPRSPATFA